MEGDIKMMKNIPQWFGYIAVQSTLYKNAIWEEKYNAKCG